MWSDIRCVQHKGTFWIYYNVCFSQSKQTAYFQFTLMTDPHWLSKLIVRLNGKFTDSGWLLTNSPRVHLSHINAQLWELVSSPKCPFESLKCAREHLSGLKATFPLSWRSWWALSQVYWADSKTEVCKKELNKKSFSM